MSTAPNDERVAATQYSEPGAEKARLLLIDTDPGSAELTAWLREREAFDVVHASGGEEGLRLAAAEPPAAILLGCLKEGLSSVEACRRVRRMPDLANLPVIMITARDDEASRISGFEAGADDCLVKPVSRQELAARVRSLVRRAQSASAGEKLSFEDLEMDLARYRVRRAGRTVSLAPTEFRLLRYFMEHPRRVMSRERLLAAVWGRGRRIDIRTVDAHVRRLRKALGAHGGTDLIRTVREAGYSLDDEHD